MIDRCIMIFPKFHNMNKIQEIRKKYDPLYCHVDPHITLVYPFSSHITTEQLHGHVAASLKNIRPFRLVLEGFSKEEGNYIFLNVATGAEQLTYLHNQLYTGILREYYPSFLASVKYVPHVTVGKTSELMVDEAFAYCKSVKEKFVDEISEVAVEIIDENKDSRIEMTIPFD